MEKHEPHTADQPPAAEQRPTAENAVQQPPTVEELEDRWRRAAADLDNYRKRCARQIELERAAERARVARLWLPVVDDLERALGFAKLASGESSAGVKEQEGQAFVDGIRSVRDQAVSLLAALGYPRDDETGVSFDPFRHEAVGVAEDADVPPGNVVEVVRPGYGKGAHQLRPAAVVVAGQRG